MEMFAKLTVFGIAVVTVLSGVYAAASAWGWL
jgi:hypothetical protein